LTIHYHSPSTGALLGLLAFGVGALFLSKPVHIDEANFLALAQGPLWDPHAIRINWQGREELAFDVLSNPPGIAWWLHPVRDAALPLQRLWMLPWSLLALWGAWALGRMLAPGPGGASKAAALLLCSPLYILSSGALMPDMPLMACILAGAGGAVGGRRWLPIWAFVAGCAFLFRYSGIAAPPLIALWFLLRHEPRRAVSALGWGLLPALLLLLHDLDAYGAWHFWEMVSFQSEGSGARGLFRGFAASLAMLAGGACLPLLFSGRAFRAGLLAGAVVGAAACAVSGISGAPAAWNLLWISLGAGVAAGSLSWRSPEARWLSVWLLGGLLFLCLLRFSATRYWAPFYMAAILAGLRQSGGARAWPAGIAGLGLGLLLAADDLEFARAQRALALGLSEGRTGVFSGHWGWQHYMEEAGWSAAEEDSEIPTGVWYAESAVAWPQEPLESCREEILRISFPDSWPGPRVHSAGSRSNFHAYAISGPIETYAPWGWGGGPQDTATLWRYCP
jgi:hypothetical protein